MEPINKDGISMAGILSFIDACGGREKLSGLTTSAVCSKFMAPMTAAAQSSYCASGLALAESVKPAAAFVSHAWATHFLRTVDALAAWERERPDSARQPTIFWFDIFSNSQHGCAARPFSWWQTVFRDNVAAIGRTLLVLEFDDPKPLSRAWCLVEIVASLSTGAALDVVSPPEDGAAFVTALLGDFTALAARTCNVDVARATAFHGGECLRGGDVCSEVAAGRIAACPGDLSLILEATRTGVGFDETNTRVGSRMRAWMASVGTAALNEIPPEERGGSALINQLAALLGDGGDFQAAADLQSEALSWRRANLGEEHEDTLTSAQTSRSCWCNWAARARRYRSSKRHSQAFDVQAGRTT